MIELPARGLSEETIGIVCTIPGVRHARGGLVFPEHAAPIVFRTLRGLGVDVVALRPVPRGRGVALPERWSGEIRPWVFDFLTPYQKAGLRAALGHRGFYLIWPAGSGKTLAAILWALAVPGTVLVLCKAAARPQWASEVQRFTTVDPFIVGPARTPRKGETIESIGDYCQRTADSGQRPFVIAAWESLQQHRDELLGLRPASIVFDEMHLCKNWKRWRAIPAEDGGDVVQVDFGSGTTITIPEQRLRFVDRNNRSSTAEKLSRLAPRRLGCSASPVSDRLRDLWSQFDLLLPGEFGRHYAFTLRYCSAHPNPWGGLDTTGRSNVEELVERIRYFSHSISIAETHRDLPPKRRMSYYLRQEDQDALRGSDAEAEAETVPAEGAPRPARRRLEYKLMLAAARKRSAIVDLIEEHVTGCGQRTADNGPLGKIVVFTGRRADADLLGSTVRKRLPDLLVWVAHGSSDTIQREAIRQEFMVHPGPCVLIGTADAWGESYNLHEADVAIIAMLPFTPRMLQQSEGRFWRRGQQRPVLIYYVIAENTVDEHVASILIEKLPPVEQVTGDPDLGQLEPILGGIDDEEAVMQSIMDKITHAAVEGESSPA